MNPSSGHAVSIFGRGIGAVFVSGRGGLGRRHPCHLHAITVDDDGPSGQSPCLKIEAAVIVIGRRDCTISGEVSCSGLVFSPATISGCRHVSRLALRGRRIRDRPLGAASAGS